MGVKPPIGVRNMEKKAGRETKGKAKSLHHQLSTKTTVVWSPKVKIISVHACGTSQEYLAWLATSAFLKLLLLTSLAKLLPLA
jgi:hypothetical protein